MKEKATINAKITMFTSLKWFFFQCNVNMPATRHDNSRAQVTGRRIVDVVDPAKQWDDV